VRRAADEEDVALSAFNSFCLRAEEGRFLRLDDSDDLWQVLMTSAATSPGRPSGRLVSAVAASA
jgi:hypothetical protein